MKPGEERPLLFVRPKKETPLLSKRKRNKREGEGESLGFFCGWAS